MTPILASEDSQDGAPNELALEEELDMRDPLRHLMIVEPNDSDPGSYSLLPPQQRSVQHELVCLSFPADGEASRSLIELTLSVTARQGCGGVTWPAGEVLANYLVTKGAYISGKTVLELGSGTGLVGLVAGKLGAKVWITDQAPLVGIMKGNVTLNDLAAAVTVCELNWGELIPAHIPRPDIIVAADCVYFEPAFPLLVQTLSGLSDETTEVLFCYKKRRKADKRFFLMLKKEFTWEEVNDDPNRTSYNRDAISLLRLQKRRHGR